MTGSAKPIITDVTVAEPVHGADIAERRSKEKTEKYEELAKQHNAKFVPFVMETYGSMHRSCVQFSAALEWELAPSLRKSFRRTLRIGVQQALLTGNVQRGARTKLSHHGLWGFFPFGAFADDSEHRNDLGPHALRRAREHTGVDFPPDRVWIIGDTPHDIACGRVIGAKTLAVATGSHPVEALAAHQPTAVLADLSDPAAFWRLIDTP